MDARGFILKEQQSMNASYPKSAAARARPAHEERTQVAVETAPEREQLATVLEFLCRAMEDESVDRVIACIHPLNKDATMFLDAVAPSLDTRYSESTKP
jgi:hypothetical protein